MRLFNALILQETARFSFGQLSDRLEFCVCQPDEPLLNLLER